MKVGPELLGCLLCRRQNGKVQKFLIVETESYEGKNDLASHASKGETKRNTVMFGPPGVWYVYFTYGMHYMLNIVCGRESHPAAVLIRGITHPKFEMSLIGPARLTKKLLIDKTFNGKVASPKSDLWIESPSPKASTKKGKIIKTPRIGVDYSGPIWSKKLYRFVFEGFETKKFKI